MLEEFNPDYPFDNELTYTSPFDRVRSNRTSTNVNEVARSRRNSSISKEELISSCLDTCLDVKRKGLEAIE